MYVEVCSSCLEHLNEFHAQRVRSYGVADFLKALTEAFETSAAAANGQYLTMEKLLLYEIEEKFLHSQILAVRSSRTRLESLRQRLQEVSNHVSTMLQIQQENQGNAIIVFTIVTIIFLPLSWVTSYLGMNTADIRDLEQGQRLFWCIAMPVTSIVIGAAVVVVVKGEAIREFLIRREGTKHHRIEEKKRALRRRTTMLSLAPQAPNTEKWFGLRRRMERRKEDEPV